MDIEKIISASKYYVGIPDGLFFSYDEFPKDVVEAKKAYITINTLLGNINAEKDRFLEGKKQIPNLICEKGLKRIIDLYTFLYYYSLKNSDKSNFETVRACRQSEISLGESIIETLTSTTKLSLEEIINLGYSNKNGLALCKYIFNKGALYFDLENLGKDYVKPYEREVLVMFGNIIKTEYIGKSNYLGKDNKPGLLYKVNVYGPQINIENKTLEELESRVYNREKLNKIKEFYTNLNDLNTFPEYPFFLESWKKDFKSLVYKNIEMRCKY